MQIQVTKYYPYITLNEAMVCWNLSFVIEVNIVVNELPDERGITNNVVSKLHSSKQSTRLIKISIF